MTRSVQPQLVTPHKEQLFLLALLAPLPVLHVRARENERENTTCMQDCLHVLRTYLSYMIMLVSMHILHACHRFQGQDRYGRKPGQVEGTSTQHTKVCAALDVGVMLKTKAIVPSMSDSLYKSNRIRSRIERVNAQNLVWSCREGLNQFLKEYRKERHAIWRRPSNFGNVGLGLASRPGG